MALEIVALFLWEVIINTKIMYLGKTDSLSKRNFILFQFSWKTKNTQKKGHISIGIF